MLIKIKNKVALLDVFQTSLVKATQQLVRIEPPNLDTLYCIEPVNGGRRLVAL